MITNLEEFNAYQRALAFGEVVWSIVRPWDNFTRYTIGIQWVKSVDSIAANLSEGLGRFSTTETRQFAFYSRGSVFETKTWLHKAYSRHLLYQKTFSELMVELDIIGKMINKYIKSLGTGL